MNGMHRCYCKSRAIAPDVSHSLIASQGGTGVSTVRIGFGSLVHMHMHLHLQRRRQTTGIKILKNQVVSF